MASTWPSNTAADYAADKAVRESRAKAIRDRGQVLIQTPFEIQSSSVSSQRVYIAAVFDFMLDHTLHLAWVGSWSGGSGTREGRIRVGVDDFTQTLLIGGWTNWIYTGADVLVEPTVFVDSSILRPEIPELGHAPGSGLFWRVEVETVSGSGTAIARGEYGPNAWLED